MASNEKSLVVYQSRTVWMNNLLTKLGILSTKDEVQENEDKRSPSPEEQQSVFDDQKEWDTYIKGLDPKDWKDQDHYRILGLSKRRIDSTESEIKKAYRKVILRHHPDKRGGQKKVDLDYDYYSCITKAWEILSDPLKRRSYDSVDPTFDNTIPNATTYNKNRFFEIFTDVFEQNARWSNKTPVPLLGDENSTFEEVNDFYNFWYNFDSWREYSYLDEEEKEKGENREERRYLDKQNKIARNQRKKEEMQRIRQLVDNAYNCDPRIVRFKEEEKNRRKEMKQAKQEAIRAKREEEERIQREKEEKEAEKIRQQEELEKQKRDEEKRQKEALKKKFRKECKQLESFFDGQNYFTDDPGVRIERMKELDKMCKIFTLEQLVEFREKIQSLVGDSERKDFFLGKVEEFNKKLEDEREKLLNANSTNNNNNTTNNKGSKKVWSYDDVQLLIKAVKLFPAGTKNRWTVVANFVNDKNDSGVTRNHKDVLEKAKELQQGDSQTLKEEANKNAFKKLETQMVANPVAPNESTPSQRYDDPSAILEVNDTPWSNDEQQLLEQAMKTYPSSLGTERWDKIASCIANRSRADCIKRYKHLVEIVKAKNAAKAKAKAK